MIGRNRSQLIYIDYNKFGLAAFPQPGAGKHGTWLASFLTDDLQYSIKYSQYILEFLYDLESGAQKTDVFGGNSIDLVLKVGGAELEHLIFDDQPNEHYTLAEIRAAVEDWLEAIQQHKNSRADG